MFQTLMAHSGPQKAPKPRDRLLNTATRLFYRDGMDVGVDRITAEAEVAPMTLYRQFGGKDELMAEALEQWGAEWLERLHDRADRYGDDADARLDDLLNALEEWFAAEDFHGSFVSNAAVELRGKQDHPAQQVIYVHRLAIRQFLADLAKLSGALDPVAVTDQLQVLFEGTVAVAVMDRRLTIAKSVRALAHTLLATK